MRVWPCEIRCSTAIRAPRTLSTKHHVDLGVGQMTTRENDPHSVAGKRRHFPVGKPDGREYDAVDLALAHGLDNAALAFGIAVGAREQESVAKGRGDVLRPADELRVEGIADVGDHKADCVAAAQAEPLRNSIGRITELRDRASDTRLVLALTYRAPFRYFDTVPFDTPAKRATSLIVACIQSLHLRLLSRSLRERKPVLQNYGHRQACYRG